MTGRRCVQIAGGGLAGLALGVALRRRDVPVQLFEAETYPRHRVCGEFMSGITSDELDGLGIAALLEDAARHRTTSWHDTGRTPLTHSLPRPALGISRFALDHRLADRFSASGGELHTGTRAPKPEHDEGWVVATGRAREGTEWLGLKAHFHQLDLDADLEIHLSDGGYLGLTRVEAGRTNACGLFHRTEPLKSRDKTELLPTACEEVGMTQLADRLRAAQIDPASLKGVSQFLLGWQKHARSDELRLGDQAALIPPVTGNGMSMALQSALDAVGPLSQWSEGDQPWSDAVAAIRRAHRQRFTSRLRWARLLQTIVLQPRLRRLAMALLQRRWLSFDRVFERTR